MIPITHPFRKVREKDGAPGKVREKDGAPGSESVPSHKPIDETQRWTTVVTHPCAQNAQGWGTRL